MRLQLRRGAVIPGQRGPVARIVKPFTTMFMVFGLIAGAELSAAIATEFLSGPERELTALVNQEREARGLSSLPTSDALRTVARRHAQRMMLGGSIFHSTTLADDIGAQFPKWAKIGENVGVGPTIPRTHQAFMESEGHRANLLDPVWQTLGIGVVSGGSRLFMTENFVLLRDGVAVPPDVLAVEPTPTAAPGPSTSGTNTTVRVFGSSRVDTARELAQFAFPARSAGAAVLADAFDFHGALAGAGLAGQVGGPIVLTSTSVLDGPAQESLVRALGAGSNKTVHLVGSFSSAVINSVRGLGLRVEQHSGATHAQTAAAVARALPRSPEAVFVARDDDYPDALAASAVAAQAGWPILFTNSSSLSNATADVIRELGPTTVHVVGGTSAVSSVVAAQLRALGVEVVRTSGPSRIDTALAIAELGIEAGLLGDTVQLATGYSFPDALAGGGAAPRLGAPVVLTEPSSLSGATRAWLRALDPDRVVLLGGTGALASAVEAQVRDLG